MNWASLADSVFAWQNWTWAKMVNTTGKSKVYLYHFTRVPPYYPDQRYSQMDPPSKLGAYHGIEFPYVFNFLDSYPRPYTDVDVKLADAMSSYWVNLAKKGDPNGPGLPDWPPFDDKNNRVMYLGDKIELGPLPNKAGLDFWDAFYARQRGK
jgi:para-nitrobenzyl esterase